MKKQQTCFLFGEYLDLTSIDRKPVRIDIVRHHDKPSGTIGRGTVPLRVAGWKTGKVRQLELVVQTWIGARWPHVEAEVIYLFACSDENI